MNKGVAVTGMGIISSIGLNCDENLNALLQKHSGLSRIKRINTIHRDAIKVGEIPLTNEELIQKLELPETNNYSRSALLGAVAAEEAVKMAGISDMNDCRTGLISSTSVGGMDMTEQYYFQYFEEDTNRKYIDAHALGDSTSKIAERLGITGFVTTISTACSSSTNAIMLGARMIRSGRLDRVIVGGTDALSKFTINGFKTLMILSETDCKPFDRDRTGLNLGEAAAYLVLESDEVVARENRRVLARITGYANSNDAFHQTASSDDGEGATLAMEKALKVAGMAPQHIDYINAHGTATLNNDSSESKAIRRIFSDKVPVFSSTKAFTGHTLAAAGAVEAVFSIFSLQENKVFPNLNFNNPIPDTGLVPVTEVTDIKMQHILSNSFGFGGNCSTLIISKN